MPLTMPALFIFLEMKDYVPDTWAGRKSRTCQKSQPVTPSQPAHGVRMLLGRERPVVASRCVSKHSLVHPDLTVALANPIKFFNAHDKKSVKLKEAMPGVPEVCAPPGVCRRGRACSVGEGP